MKLSIAIADTNALPSAFVVFRGFEKNISKAGKLGFDGVELALKRADEINPTVLKELLDASQVEVSCISTGQVYAESGLMFTDERTDRRNEVLEIFKELIDLAEHFGKIVNIGRVRGQIGNRPKAVVEELFIEIAKELCSYAEPKGVTLVMEPVNRYEIDFINTVEEGAKLIEKLGAKNMKLMPDVFHMNIEDRAIGSELLKYISYIKYVHLADSNRLAPGQGHIDFQDIFYNLLQSGYNDWVSVEILPRPNPDIAAKQAIDFLMPMIQEFNHSKTLV